MKTINHIIFAAALLAAMVFTFSCSDSDSSGELVKKARITGVSQKGPFVEGSEVTLYELNSDLEQTGRSFTDIIADNKGSFEIKNIELVSPYALLKANGFYRNENTGEVSSAPITLFAIADIREKDQVNVNILTHLEYYRVLNLAETEGKSIKEAKKQAQKEIFAVFGIESDGFKDSEDMTIFGTTESDAALLAISVLLQGDLSEGEFSQRLTNFSQGIKEGGVWSNEEAKSAMTAWAFGANFGKIKNNILSWGLFSEVPEFEKYLYDYWVAAYGLGDCGSSNEYEMKAGGDEKGYICKYGVWRKPSYMDRYCAENACEFFVDGRDNQRYAYVAIGEQVWMSENLNYDAAGSKCYGDDLDYCEKYGRLYDWETAAAACPAGWHLPSNDEWETLSKIADCFGVIPASEWDYGRGMTDDYGFAALPGGSGYNPDDGFVAGIGATWWSATESATDNSQAYGNFINLGKSIGTCSLKPPGTSLKNGLGFKSARCLKD